MKKMFCLLAALLILCCTPGLSCADGGQEIAVTRLLEQLSAFMDAQEQILGRLLNCCRETGRFCEHGDYPSLVRARLTCSAALEELRAFRLPEMALDEDTLLALAEMGVEVTLLDDQEREIRNALEDGIQRESGEETFMHSYAIYLKEGLAALEKANAVVQEFLSLNAEYICYRLNSLLLPLSGIPEVSAFWNGLPERWPLIAQYRQPWISDSASLSEAGAAVINEMADRRDDMDRVYGMSAYAVQKYLNNPDTVAADFRWPAGAPSTVLPLPAFWQDSAGKSLHADAGYSGTESLPETLTWRIPDVSAEQYMAYIQQLKSLGLPVELDESDPARLKAVIGTGKTRMNVYWLNSVVYIAWYPDGLTLEIR